VTPKGKVHCVEDGYHATGFPFNVKVKVV